VRVRLLCVAVLASVSGCDFSAGGKVFGDSGDSGSAAEGSGSGNGTGGGGAGGSGSGTGSDGAEDGTTDPADLDEDGDGFTVGEGDCDDGDPAVFPGQTDRCDGRDEDCDGDVDEDARYEDEYEDNDTNAAFLGDLSGGGSVSLDALLDSADDIDRFTVQTDDSGWSLWSMTIRVSSIPDGYTWRLRVTTPTGDTLEEVGSGALTIEADDAVFNDEAGTWNIVLDAVDDAPCDARYLLTVDFSG
jgi:hypothetical protein